MNFSIDVLRNEEKALYSLRQLYMQHGYARYKVSKFEEYDLYAGNKSFLISENILTFTDTNGKLMALKPDVTLSIVKNVRSDVTDTHKVYYNENVYRTSGGTDGFREIMQTGLEYIGRVDDAAVGEVLTLAQKSLAMISDDYILDLSHMGFVTGLLEVAGVNEEDEARLLSLVESKNVSAIRSLCAEYGVSEAHTDALCEITSLYEPLKTALPKIRGFVSGEKMQEAYAQLCALAEILERDGDPSRLYLDFSIVNDMNYYDGIIFRGFINGIPDGILSGGRYDKLLSRMGKRSGAIGFAVYLDMLERLEIAAAGEREE
ncbi:MAG: ATP phosphoribosyltransferase regulatory subunit [Clostridia bacterium]|nr:ATP phosphoribosyltransferase regulatory subunit [Clostridia bacterium]